MDEKTALQVTEQVMRDQTPMAVTIEIRQAWLLVSGIQFATRHPGVSEPLRAALEQTARQFQQGIADLHPIADVVLEMGWNPDFDVKGEG